MALGIDLLRPDDLLNLRVEGLNLRLDLDDADAPSLVVEDAGHPAYLAVTFPPQTIAERAFFAFSIVKPEGDPKRPDAETDPTKPEYKASSEPLLTPGQVKARIGRPSRLVFEVPPGTRIPFSSAGLLDWSGLVPSVHPIAAIGPDPTPEEIAQAPGLRAPEPHETALELPFRLVISPGRDVAWAHRFRPFTARGRTELWHTRLQLRTPGGTAEELSGSRRAPLRAVWALDAGYDPKKRPDDPLALDPDLGRTAMSIDDRYQLVILTSAFHGYEVEQEVIGALLLQQAGGMEIRPPAAIAVEPVLQRERDVAVLPNLDLDIRPLIGGAGDGAFGGNGALAGVGRLDVRLPRIKQVVPYVPEPFEAEQLMLSPLGGWLRSRGVWDPPREKKPPPWLRPVRLREAFEQVILAAPLPGPGLGFAGEIAAPPRRFERDPESLDLSEWVHVATQGRDHYVRIVYEGKLVPGDFPAALIKETERTFKEVNGLVVAYLMQWMTIVVRDPVRTFGDPFKRVELTTLETPRIADPDYIKDPETGLKRRSFWVEVMTSATTRDLFQFHALRTDKSDTRKDFTLPMMFVSKSDYDDGSAATASRGMKIAAAEYNAPANAERRRLRMHGQEVTFAERDPAAPNDNTRLVTESISFVIDAAGGPPQMLKADVRIPQVEELLGTEAPTTIRYHSGYLKNGFDGAAGVFAEVVKQDLNQHVPDDPSVRTTLGVTFGSDQAGGFATPNLGVSTLTRALGPLAGRVEDALTGTFDPAAFFKGVTARLFGSFDLVDLLPDNSSLGQNAPKLRTQTQDLPGVPGGKLLVATLDWEPEIQNVPDTPGFAVARFTKRDASKLRIHGRIEKALKPGVPADGEAMSDFRGTLNDFQVSVLESVAINFTEFSFHARSGQKTDVQVRLDAGKPIEFNNDLKFVEELRNAIPPGLFGDGPSLDVTPTGIRAGFALALPPVSVGVFSLKDVSLGAALTLPFLDGKPVFDFNVSERPRPFLLAVAFFGGGGFFHLQLDTAGIRQLEAAFEFGATAALDIGVASGEVHIMAGIYFSMQRKEPGTDLVATLSGYMRLGGSLSVLGIIKLSVEFVLSFTYDGGKDKAYGRATLTVQVEIVFFSVSVALTVERGFGGASGDPTFGAFFNTPQTWSDYALAFA
jgi:hypothetical protein